MSQAEPMSRRKSTRKRVGQAETSEFEKSIEQDEGFRPSSEQWKSLEAAYGKDFPEPLRIKIADAVEHYFFFEPLERHAPSADDALNYVRQVRKAAFALQRSLQTTATGEAAD